MRGMFDNDYVIFFFFFFYFLDKSIGYGYSSELPGLVILASFHNICSYNEHLQWKKAQMH